jgi:hypothetical protein
MKVREVLTEGLAKDKAEKIIDRFVQFAADHLELDSLPEISLKFDSKRSVEHKSFGGYAPGHEHITITVSNRHVMDVCRTLAHELVHYKQDLNNQLEDDNAGATGSPQENEANAEAAVIMRNWGKKYPTLFNTPAVD